MKRLAAKPFALLGVNSDSKERLKQTIKKQSMTWRSWWDGGDTDGPIATKWNVTGWPTIYVLDHKGVIRHKNVREKELDDAVDALVAELEREQAKGKPR